MIAIKEIVFTSPPRARFNENYKFKITFECMSLLEDDVEWKLIFVASPDNLDLDQELDDCLVGPIPVGVNSFEFDANPPDPTRIPKQDILGVAAIILTGSYRDQEFVRVGYYQNTEYDNEEMNENPPPTPRYDRLVRELADKPRVTRFNIRWDGGMIGGSAPSAPAPNQPQQPFNSPVPGAAFPREYSGGPINSAFVPSANGNSMAIG
ncbi:Histone chaperone ASF1 AltName: Full=Anti-silencing function protein 1 [Serendipita indica DSM 11827]|uniref:Anti-silencing function protein 1 n=1 Tax=Serendipita indica (strain DSM 11827) TaxID=1109443 RepID=G4T541_SERID|nr:Histone chaperone ASF1 AltName: Full=Anti-silencing function protein 1 [Serendipita indica DSM 11827]CCA66434.1 related to anti-silencing protein 1 [Serendipita indica DSM 11827]